MGPILDAEEIRPYLHELEAQVWDGSLEIGAALWRAAGYVESEVLLHLAADNDPGESDFDGYDPADAEFDRWAHMEAPAEYAELEAEMELGRLEDALILDALLP
jgi:hypothetical protein